MAIEPIKGFYVHDEETGTDGVAKYDYGELANFPFGDNVTMVTYKTGNGYIAGGGGIAGADAGTQEVYTNKLPCYPGDTVTAKFTWESTEAKWVTCSFFDENGKFSTRSNSYYNGNDTNFEITVTFPENAYYYAFSYRTYGTHTTTLLYSGSVYDVRNRVDKGLSHEPINGGFDYCASPTLSFINDVMLFGDYPVTDFIPVTPESIFNLTINSEYIGSYLLCFFDGDKNYIGCDAWHAASRYAVGLGTQTKYVRVMFDKSTTVENIKNYFSCKTVQPADALTPIICGYTYPSLDTVNKTFTIPNDCMFFKNGAAVLPSELIGTTAPIVINLPALSASSAQRLFFDLGDNTFKWSPWSTRQIDFEKLILVGVFRFWQNESNFYSVAITCPYYKDGKLYGVDTTAEVDFDTIAWAFGENVKGVNHRGYYTAPENTLPAYKLSKQNGFKYCETDISYTSDGVAVLLHDSTINRTARNEDGTEISDDIAINTITYEQALQYDFGIYKGAQYAGTQIPSFEQFIALCKNIGLRPYIELKAGTETQTHGLVDTVKRYGMDGRVTWISFSSTLLAWVKNYDPAARIGFVTNDIDSSTITTAQDLKTSTNEVFIDASRTVTDEKINLCVDANIPLEVWTVDSASVIEALNPYISGVTSDNLIASKVLYDANKD